LAGESQESEQKQPCMSDVLMASIPCLRRGADEDIPGAFSCTPQSHYGYSCTLTAVNAAYCSCTPLIPCMLCSLLVIGVPSLLYISQSCNEDLEMQKEKLHLLASI